MPPERRESARASDNVANVFVCGAVEITLVQRFYSRNVGLTMGPANTGRAIPKAIALRPRETFGGT
jgi:hypothetical protein